MIIDMTIGAVDQSAMYTSSAWAFLVGPLVAAGLTATVLSGTGSFANISGPGSHGVVTGTASDTSAITGRGGV